MIKPKERPLTPTESLKGELPKLGPGLMEQIDQGELNKFNYGKISQEDLRQAIGSLFETELNKKKTRVVKKKYLKRTLPWEK